MQKVWLVRKTEIAFIIFASILITYSWLDGLEYESRLNIQYVHLDSVHKVIPINDSLVIPVLYDSLIITNTAPAQKRKEQFVNQVLPAILIVKYHLENKSKKVNRIIKKIESNIVLRPKEEVYADSLMKCFRAKSYENLLMRMQPHPASLVLAQAALESGWGSSRFAMEGNNLFGMWASSKDRNVIRSLFKRSDNQIYVKKYLNVAESIDHYFLTIGRNNAYRKFRAKRYEQANVFQLIETLDKYSERGEEYTNDLRKIIEWNALQKYDYYGIDPDYIQHITVWDHYMDFINMKISNVISSK